MASSNDMHQSAQPFVSAQHLVSMNATPITGTGIHEPMNLTGPISTTSNSLLSRPTNIRAPSQILSPGNMVNMNVNRISRRKSVTSGPQTNIAAVAAVLEGGSSLALPVPSSKRYMSNIASPHVSASRSSFAIPPTPPSSLPNDMFLMEVKREVIEQNSDDMQRESSAEAGSFSTATSDSTLDPSGTDDKTSLRRASEDQPVTREGGKRFNRVELRCDRCGKSYKHSSCLTKHLWEHTPEWQYTSKLLISKHQQVQLLEAASVLVSMNNEAKSDVAVFSPPNSLPGTHPDIDMTTTSNSYHLGIPEITPPPLEGLGIKSNHYQFSAKRYSTGGIFKVYKSLTGHRGSILSVSPSTSSMGHGRKRSEDYRPSSSGRSATSKDDRELAAAVEQLSCSYGKKIKPPKILNAFEPIESVRSYASGFFNTYPSKLPESFARGSRIVDDDVSMGGSDFDSVAGDDHDYDMRARSEEEDEGIFGAME